MPPEENTNKNIPNLDPFKVSGIDPVFKSASNQQNNPNNQGLPANAYNVLSSQKYIPQTPTAPIYIKPVETTATPKSIIRTYKGDLESAVQNDHLSSINIAIAENKKMHEQIRDESMEAQPANDYSKNKIILFVSLILIIIGIIGIAVAYLINAKNTSPAIVTQELPSLITTEYKGELNIDSIAKNKFVSALSSKLNDTQITVNNFSNIYITSGTSTAKKLVNSSEFVSLAGFKMSDLIKRTLLPDFMVGTYSFGKNLPFVIFKTSSFENTYAGMLDWEKDLEENFRLLFRLSGYEKSGGILTELTPTNYKKFEDGVIINKDVRLLRGDDGQIMLLYGIIDKETIVITVNDVAFKEIINRLNKEKGLKR